MKKPGVDRREATRGSVPGALVAVTILAVVGLLAIVSFAPPAPLPGDGPADEFSAHRALRDLAVIAARPRPIGSPAVAGAREYLRRQLEEAGVDVEVQSALSIRRVAGDCLAAGDVGNVLARVRGTDSRNAVLLVAHFDSAAVSPGAVDNGSGTVTLLELARAVRAGPPLKNDVIVLFSDGHEATLLGANVFVESHPWMADVRIAINVDGAGTGPPVIVRTSPMNGRLVERYAESVPRPTASSFVSALGRLLPGDRDIAPFLEAGIPGLDLGPAGWSSTYHSALDLPEEIGAASLQHMGIQLIALVRDLANQDLEMVEAANQVHFPVAGIQIRHPERWALPCAAVVGALCLSVLVLGVRRARFSPRGAALSSVVFLVGLAIAVGGALLLWRAIVTFHPEYAYAPVFRRRFEGDWLYAWCLLSLTIAVFSACHGLVRRKVGSAELAAGPLAVWALLALVSAVLVPALSFLFLWPLVFQVPAVGYLAVFARPEGTDGARWRWVVVALTALPAVVLWVPLPYLLFEGLGLAWAVLFIGMVWLLLGALAVPLGPLVTTWRGGLSAVGILGTLGFLVAGHVLASSGGLPRLVAPMGYWIDADTRSAHWVTTPDELDHRRRRIMGEAHEASYSTVSRVMGRQTVRVSGAPAIDIAAPGFELLSDERRADGSRIACARITSVLRERTFVFAHPELDGLAFRCAPGSALGARSHSVRHDGGWFNFRVDGAPAGGFEVRMESAQPGPIELVIIDVASGLPKLPDVDTAGVPGATVSPPDPGLSIPMEFTAIQRTISLPP